jgi:RNA polymerase sigma factor for flagellar operon FliA
MSAAEVSRLLKAHTPLVKRIVGGILRRVPGHILVDDLIAAGLSGLWDAIRRCGHLPPEHFRRYAGVRIRGAVYDELRAQDWLPRRMRAAITAKARRDEKVSLGVVFLEDLSDAEQPPMSDDPQTLNGEEFLAAKAFGQRLVDALERLPARERRIILGHHLQGLKLRDLGAELQVTDARVSQLHGRAMKRLKAMMAEAEEAS